MSPLSPWATPGSSPLTAAPALVLCAGKESAVLTGGSPTRAAPAAALPAFFPRDGLRVVAAAPGGGAGQHASLVFHHCQFLPRIAAFDHGLKACKLRIAA